MNEVFVCVWFFETQPSARHIINMKIKKKMKKRERKEAQKLVSLNKISEKKNKRKKKCRRKKITKNLKNNSDLIVGQELLYSFICLDDVTK